MSRQKSARAARSSKGRATAARGAGGRQIMVPKAKSDVWVALLGVSLGAIMIGALLLVLVLNRYEFQTTVS